MLPMVAITVHDWHFCSKSLLLNVSFGCREIAQWNGFSKAIHSRLCFPLPFAIFWCLQYLLRRLGIYRRPVNRTVKSTEYTDTLKSIFLSPFRKPEEGKSGVVYWQSILIARRFILTFLSCFITDLTLRLMWMAIICVLLHYTSALLHHN